jgi:tetratricopeptide (TPR) repeat protein
MVVYDARSEAYGVLGQHRLAIEDYDMMLQLDPGSPSVYTRKATGLFRLGLLDEAIQNWDEGIETYDERIIYLRDKEGQIDTALKLIPDLALAYNNRGSARYQLTDISGALEGYHEAIRLSPKSPDFYVNRASVYELLNKDTEAKRDLEQAKKLGFAPFD